MKSLREKLFWILLGISFLINIISWAWLYFAVPKGSFPFILHYNIYFGRDLLGERLALFQIPLVGLVILTINFALGYFLFNKDKFLAWVVLASTIALELLVLYASGIIISVNR